MADVKGRMIQHDEGEEHIMRRLAKAVAVQWSTLSAEDQKRVLQTATFMHDGHQTVQLEQQISAWIERVGKAT